MRTYYLVGDIDDGMMVEVSALPEVGDVIQIPAIEDGVKGKMLDVESVADREVVVRPRDAA